MIIGVPTEIKNEERRVGLTPSAVRELTDRGHDVIVQAGAGAGIGAADDDYLAAGARLSAERDDIFEQATLIVKVKEPQAEERALLHPGQTLFTYLHLAPDPEQTRDLIASGATCIAYETVTDDAGGLPLLAPMSQIAGRMAVQAGAHCLESAQGGAGVLLGGVPGVRAGQVVVIGGGVVGEHAIEAAVGLGASVTVLDRSLAALDRLNRRLGPSLNTIYATGATVEEWVTEADLVIGAVLVRGDRAPKIVTEDMVRAMRDGSVIVDVSIDQGGCCETSRPTTHADPILVTHGVVHYGVGNMPGAVPKTSTYALNNATLPFVLSLADLGAAEALRRDRHLRNGLNVAAGEVTEPAVADELGYAHVPAEDLLDRI